MIRLKIKTSREWVETVLADFDSFLLDHAACERKASSMAMSMLAHYPDQKSLVAAMVDLAVEELQHFKQVMQIIQERGLVEAADKKDPYVNQLRNVMRKGREEFFLDRLLVAGVIEARGCERFGLVANALEAGELKSFYEAITRSEDRHHELFIELALEYFPEGQIKERLGEMLDIEANIIESLPLRAALH